MAALIAYFSRAGENYFSGALRTVQVGISMLQGLEFSDYTLVMAGIVLVLLPCVLIFVVGFRFFIAGITEGAVKG